MTKEEIDQIPKTIKDLPKLSFLDLLLIIPFLNKLITKQDQKVLQYLTNINLERSVDCDDFLVEFEFGENPFFENESLQIKFLINPDSEFDFGIVEIKSDQIDWKPQQNFLYKKSRSQSGEERIPSFFWLFRSFKSVDFSMEEEDFQEIELDDYSDRGIFQLLLEVCMIFKEDFLLYIFPRLFELEIQGFLGPVEGDSEYESIEEDDN